MDNNKLKFISLWEELETSRDLIKAGFGSLQEINGGNDFYHIPHLLIASGLERLMKCFIILVEYSRNGSYPSPKMMLNLGHDLTRILEKVCDEYYDSDSRSFLQDELTFLREDPVLKECVKILSVFGMWGRYYNLDVVTGKTPVQIDPKEEWKKLEDSIEGIDSDPHDLTSWSEYPSRVNAKIIYVLERMVRAIALQFTLGNHGKHFKRIKPVISVYMEFISITEEAIGTKDYRKSVEILRRDRHKWKRLSERRILKCKSPTRVLHKRDFGDKWPFRVERVVVQRDKGIFCLVYIDGYRFALNGATASRFNLPDPHEAGEAILGKSVSPIFEIARNL